MITYVNTVLVGTGVGSVLSAMPEKNASKDTVDANIGKYIVTDVNGTALDNTTADDTQAIRVGLVTGSFFSKGNYYPKIKWSNIIKRDDLKSYKYTEYAAESEDAVTIDFSKAAAVAATQTIRVVVRLTFKDLPTRFRKWTESYEVEVAANANITIGDITDLFVKSINEKNANRARVVASKIASGDDANKLQLVAMPYDDDNTVDSISPANKVRFTANAWLTKPEAAGFASKNKYEAAVIKKKFGNAPVGSWKLVRDAEAQAIGYQGILNRGEGTWPIIKPGMNVAEGAKYDTITLEFENMYRSADDLQRKTKQTLQVFDTFTVSGSTHTSKLAGLKAILDAFVQGEHGSVTEGTSDIID